MATYYVKDSKGSMIGKVEVDGHECKVYSIHKHYRLKSGWIFLLGLLAGALLFVGFRALNESYEHWYSECDEAYGYTTNYYTCRLYHIRGGK